VRSYAAVDSPMPVVKAHDVEKQSLTCRDSIRGRRAVLADLRQNSGFKGPNATSRKNTMAKIRVRYSTVFSDRSRTNSPAKGVVCSSAVRYLGSQDVSSSTQEFSFFHLLFCRYYARQCLGIRRYCFRALLSRIEGLCRNDAMLYISALNR